MFYTVCIRNTSLLHYGFPTLHESQFKGSNDGVQDLSCPASTTYAPHTTDRALKLHVNILKKIK